MLNLTIRAHDLTQVKNLEDLVSGTKQVGVESLQLALGRSFPDLASEAQNINPGMGQYFKRKLGKENIDIAILGCYINMIHPDLEIREKLLQKFEAYVKYAKYFGATMVASETGCVYPEIRYTEDNYAEEAFLEVIKVVKRLVKVGEKYGIMIGIEPGINHPIHSLEKIKRLIAEVDSDFLGIVFDPTNLIRVNDYENQVKLVEEAFTSFGEKIVAVHVKDFIIENQGIKPANLFEGLMHVKEILKIIEKNKPYCITVLEETKDEAIKFAVDEIIKQGLTDE